MARGWLEELTFSDRLAATSKMQVSALSGHETARLDWMRYLGTNVSTSSSAYKSVNPTCPSSEASNYAKASEEAVRKEASSLRGYHERCSEAAQLLLDTLNEESSEDQLARQTSPVLRPTGVSIGRYIDVQHFRDGLFSEIFKARPPSTAQTKTESTIVALKITTPSSMMPPHDSSREARILTAASGGRIIQLLETFKQNSRLVLVFPYMPYDLEVLLRQGPLAATSLQCILKDLFSALAHLHDMGVIHRDIKPSNILLASPSGPAYLADFGIAWSSSDSASEPANDKILDVGTTSYRPPELLFGNTSYDTSLDLWAAGCVTAQVVCLNSKTLFDAGDLGSELALIKSIFETLGTPDLHVWPEAARFPDWGKMNFREYPGQQWDAILPNAESKAVDLVSKLVHFESGDRLKAQDALNHPYLVEDSIP